MAGNMRWTTKLQGVPPIPYLHDTFLLRMLRSLGDVGMDGDSERGRIQRVVDAGKLCDVGSHIWDYWDCAGWIYGMAHSACVEGTDDD